MQSPSAAASARRFRFAIVLALALIAVFACLLASPLPLKTREVISSIGFIVGVPGIIVGGALNAVHTAGRRRRAWVMLSAAAVSALVGNVWTTAVGGDPVRNPSTFGEVCTSLALVLSIVGLLHLSEGPIRGRRLMVDGLDAVVTGCAVLILATVLVFSRLVDSQAIAERPVILLFPLLDVAVAAVAVLLVVRSQRSRSFHSLLGVGFSLYAIGDLVFAVQNPQGVFEFGTPRDLFWLAGYLVLSAVVWHPAARRPAGGEFTGSTFDVWGTTVVFTLLGVAAAVQSLFAGGPLAEPLTAFWLVLVLAIGVRQTLLVANNVALRSGLEQRVAEQTADLRRMTRQTEVMLTSVGDGIYGVDLEGCVTFVNPSGASMLGRTADALLGRHAPRAFEAPGGREPEEAGPRDRTRTYLDLAIVHGRVTTAGEDVYVRADGSTFPVELTVSPLVEEDLISGAVVIFRDVTQRREVDRMKDEFLSIVSHELRTPLTSIRGSLGMLGSGAVQELTPQADRLLSIAVNSSERLTRLINDILDVERIRSGKLPLVLVGHPAASLLATAAKEMGGLAEANGIRIEVGGGDGMVRADGDQIVQTLANLVGNAIKFSPRGSVVRLEVDAGGDDVVFSVADQGRGIPADMLRLVFEPFRQVDSSDARDKGGTGLGLAISRGIIDRHGGRIWAEPGEVAGTKVSFTLPHAHAVSLEAG